jgi:hypothetical protein
VDQRQSSPSLSNYIQSLYVNAILLSGEGVFCPLLWVSYIRALERAGRAAKDVEQVFEKALVSGIQAAEDFASIYLAYVDFVHFLSIRKCNCLTG